jgi:hypothetical protein
MDNKNNFFENLIFMPSIINPPNTDLSYSKIRSVYTRDERFKQTKLAINSVKEKIPHLKILIVECSELTNEEEKYFEDNSNYFINLFHDDESKKNIYSKSKAHGEGTMTIKAIEFILSNNINFVNFFKVCGRYKLSDKFDYLNYDNEYIVTRKLSKYKTRKSNRYIACNFNDITSTALYKLPFSIINIFLNYLHDSYDDFMKCIMYEAIFSKFIFNEKTHKIYLEFTGIMGNISVNGSILYE